MSGRPRTYQVLCSSIGSTWAVRIPELDREASAARLSQVEAVARALVTTYAPDDGAAVDFTIELMPDAISAGLAAAATARAKAVRSPVDEVLTRRQLARQLYVEGLEVADIAAALGLSPGRVQLFINTPDQRQTVTAATTALRAHASYGDAQLGELRAADRHDPEGAALLDPDGAARPARHGFRHEALPYRGDQAFLAGTVPFIEEGLALGQAVMVALPAPRLEQVRAALGPGLDDVTLVDMTRLGRNPARVIPALQQFIDKEGRHGRALRGVSEAVWPGRHPAALDECRLHETLLNLAFDPGTPLWLRCPYDLEGLGVPEVKVAVQSHPRLVRGPSTLDNPAFMRPASGSVALGGDLAAPPVTAEVLLFGRGNVRDVRQQVSASALDAGLGPGPTDDLTLAIWELAVNSVQHGGGEGVLRLWREPGALVCEIRDGGHIDDPLAGRRAPTVGGHAQRGIWLVNQLCDLVQLRTHAHGTTVRVFSWL